MEYTLKELTYSIIDEYQLDHELDYEKTKKEIDRILVKNNLKDKYERKIDRNTGHKKKYYPEAVRDILVTDPLFYDYVRVHSLSETIRSQKKYKELVKEIQMSSPEPVELLSNDLSRIDSDPSISDAEYREYKNAMMLEALFKKFYTPIDDKRLFADLERRRCIMNEYDPNIGDLQTLERLNHPQGNYYQELDTKNNDKMSENPTAEKT